MATLSAVRRDGSALHYVSKELKADREVVLASVRRQIKMSTSTKNRLVASAASLFFPHLGGPLSIAARVLARYTAQSVKWLDVAPQNR